MKRFKFSGIILAAGKGKRFGSKKQHAILDGRELYEYPLRIAREFLDEVIVVGKDIEGGNTRQKSVLRGLRAITGDYVIILEAARPLVTKEQIELLKKAVTNHWSTTLCRVPTNTIYSLGKYMRSICCELLVPQAFNTKLLITAHEKTSITNALDDTCLMKDVFSINPHFIETGNNLHKVTYPEDLEIIKTLYESIN